MNLNPSTPPTPPTGAATALPLVPPGGRPAGPVLGAWRLARLMWHLLGGVLTIQRHFGRWPAARQQAAIRSWAQQALAVLGVELEVLGCPPSAGPVLLAANHISWLDIFGVLAACPGRFVAKSEVRQWPLMGWLALQAGTLFVNRASPRDAVRVVHQMAERLKAGERLMIFPEGTTSSGEGLLPFHANLFQAAISADAPVQPLGLSFLDAASRRISMMPAYIGDDPLHRSLWRTATGAPLVVVLHFGQPQPVQGRDRRTLAAQLQRAVSDLRCSAAALTPPENAAGSAAAGPPGASASANPRC